MTKYLPVVGPGTAPLAYLWSPTTLFLYFTAIIGLRCASTIPGYETVSDAFIRDRFEASQVLKESFHPDEEED